MQASITAECVRRNLQRNYGSTEEELSQGHRFAKAYFSALNFGKDNLPTDLQPADDLALLAAHCYLGAWTTTTSNTASSSAHLELAIAILEFAVRRSKYRYQIRVLLIRLYRLAGAQDLALKRYLELEPKQIQLDTLSFWAAERGSMFSADPVAVAGKGDGQVVLGQKGGQVGMLDTLTGISRWYEQADNEVSSQGPPSLRFKLTAL